MDQRLLYVLAAIIVLAIAYYGSAELLGKLVVAVAACYLIGSYLWGLYLQFYKSRRDIQNSWNMLDD